MGANNDRGFFRESNETFPKTRKTTIPRCTLWNETTFDWSGNPKIISSLLDYHKASSGSGQRFENGNVVGKSHLKLEMMRNKAAECQYEISSCEIFHELKIYSTRSGTCKDKDVCFWLLLARWSMDRKRVGEINACYRKCSFSSYSLADGRIWSSERTSVL